MAFVLPPIKDSGINVPSFSVAELASLPSTSLTSLANSMASIQSELDVKNAQLQTRANKLSGGITVPDHIKGRSMVDTTISTDKIDTSLKSTIAPVTSTASIFDSINSLGADIISNPSAAGTTTEDAKNMGQKIMEVYKGTPVEEESEDE